MIYALNFVYGFMCSVGFSVLFNVPQKSVAKAGICGGTGWAVYYTMTQLNLSVVISTLIASLIIAILGEYFAVLDKQPATLYLVPGIIPLVPGFGIYYTMLSLLEQNYDNAMRQGIEAILIAVLIAASLTIVLSVNTYRKKRQDYLSSRQ